MGRKRGEGAIVLTDVQTFDMLIKLLRTHGPQEFGRICQGLLEVSLRRVGFTTRGRWTERPDILAERNLERYAFGVQSSKGSTVQIRERDLDGVLESEKSGYVPCVAILIVEPNVHWTIVRAKGLKPTEHSKHAICHNEIPKLTEEVNSIFLGVVKDHFEEVLGRGASVLRERLM